MSHIGKQLGNYVLLSLLGEGGFAEVYLGEHVYLKTQAAIKVLHTRLMSEQREAFLSEARSIARLKHTNIVGVLEFGIEDDIAFLVMDYALHGSLRALHPTGTRLPMTEIQSYVRQAADALQYAHHQQLIHRDVKPENMLMGAQNTLLLSDFGIAQVIQQNQQSQQVVGTITYMAPEQLQKGASPSSDQYALGAVVYEWLAGDSPFQGSFSEIATQHIFASPPPFQSRGVTIMPAVETVVMKALAKEPAQRFPTIGAFADALQEALQPSQVSASLTSGPASEPLSSLPSSNQLYGTAPLSVSSASANQHTSGLSPSISLIAAPPTQPDARQRLNVPVLTIAIMLMVISLSMISGSGITYYTTVFHPNQLHAQATVTAQARQALLQKQSQDANASAHQRIYLQATNGAPTYSSSLQANDSNQWSEYDSSSVGGCVFEGGAYHASITPGHNLAPCFFQEIAGDPLDNFAVQVEMTITKGDRGEIIFREDSNAAYLCTIGQDGSYNLAVEIQNPTTNQVTNTLLNNVSPAIKPGLNSTNLITIIARGNTIYLYVNKQYVAEVKDSTASSGYIALAALSSEHSTEVAFRQAQIWKL